MAMPKHAKVLGMYSAGWFQPAEKKQTAEEKRVQQQIYYRRHKAKTIKQNWERQIRALGCTPKMYAELLQKQGGVCAICARPNASGRQLAVDHCHRSGVVRGLLCTLCNTAIGSFGDNPDLLEKAKAYICRGTL